MGSLLQPAKLLDARQAHQRGRLTPDELRAAEDEAVLGAVGLQEELGLDVISDGEMRRASWADTRNHLEGLEPRPAPRSYPASVREMDRAGSTPLTVTGKVRSKAGHQLGWEYPFLKAHARARTKYTMAAPSYHRRFWSDAVSPESGYASCEAYLADVRDWLHEAAAWLAGQGCTYIQLDAPHYPLLIDPETRAFYERQGWTAERYIARGIELDNHVMAGHPEVTFGFHLCRGNQASRWLVSGGYEPIARAVFRNVAAQRLLLEYDDERSGSFQPLDEVPDDKMVVLGLVTTKSPRRETVEELEGRVREAARHVDLERLAVSPQCGFATSVLGNALSHDDQRAKLETLARTAERVWG